MNLFKKKKKKEVKTPRSTKTEKIDLITHFIFIKSSAVEFMSNH